MSTIATWERDHVVVCWKDNGVQVVFSRYKSRQAAELAAQQLRNVGCPCTVEPAKPGDISGMTRRDA